MHSRIKFKFISRLVAVVAAAIFTLTLCACNSGGNKPKEEPYTKPFMCGYFLIFRDGENLTTGEYITDCELDSADVVKNYFYKNYFAGGYTTYMVKGLQIFESYVNVEGQPLSSDKSGKVEICDTFRYTSELTDKWIAPLEIYFNAESGDVHYSDAVGFRKFDGLSALTFGDSMSAKVFDEDNNLREITHGFDCTIRFEQVDKLLEIEFSYFNADGVRVHSVTTNEYQGEISVSGEYDYVVINKKYEGDDGEIYYSRSSCDKSEQPYTERVYAPYGTGFTKPVDIKLSGSKIEMHPLIVV